MGFRVKRFCTLCSRPITLDRIRALPGTRVCVRCSDERKRRDVLPDGPDQSDVISSVVRDNSQD